MADSRENDRPSKRARSQHETSDVTGAPDFGVDETATPPQTYHHPSQPAFPWWALPGELRNAIYDLVLTARPSIYFHRRRRRPARAPETALLLASSRTYAEASSALYARNVFRFERPRLLRDFLAALPARPRAWLRRVQLASWRRLPADVRGDAYRCRYPTQTMLAFRCLRARCVGMDLTRVELTRGGQSAGRARPASLEELARHVLEMRDCREWLWAVGRKGGDRRAGAGVLCYSEELLRELFPAELDPMKAFRKVLGDLLVSEEFAERGG